MRKRIYSFKEFVFEQENKEKTNKEKDSEEGGIDLSAGGIGKAMLQVALDQFEFEDKDFSKIADTKETRESLPYTGCGTSPYTITPVQKTNAWLIDLFVYPDGKLSKKEEYIKISKEVTGSSYGSGGTGSTGATGPTGAPPIASNTKVKENWIFEQEGGTGATGGTGAPQYSPSEYKTTAKPYSGTKKIFLVGVREKIEIKQREGDKFIDKMLIVDPNKMDQFPETYQITTSPSVAYYGSPKRSLNPAGVAIMQPGSYDYKIGIHKKGSPTQHEALLQNGKMKINRFKLGTADSIKTYEPGEEDTGDEYGINIHRGSKAPGICVGPYSAGCQVFANGDDFNKFMTTIKASTENGGEFIYVLIDNDELSQLEKEHEESEIDKKQSEIDKKQEEEDKKKEEGENKSKEKKNKAKSQKKAAIQKAAREIKDELGGTFKDSDEGKLIRIYNSVCTDQESANMLADYYRREYKEDIIDDLDSALDSSELGKLKHKPNGQSSSDDYSEEGNEGGDEEANEE